MTTPRWLRETPDTWKALLAIGSAIALGVTLGGWFGLPAQVESLSDRVERIEQLEPKVDRILCHLEEQRSPSPNWTRCERMRDTP